MLYQLSYPSAITLIPYTKTPILARGLSSIRRARSRALEEVLGVLEEALERRDIFLIYRLYLVDARLDEIKVRVNRGTDAQAEDKEPKKAFEPRSAAHVVDYAVSVARKRDILPHEFFELLDLGVVGHAKIVACPAWCPW